MEEQTFNKNVKSLNNFILDDNLEKLEKFTDTINFFTILNIEDWELKHSNMLAWLLDSEANHNLGNDFFKKFIKKVIKRNDDKHINVEKWLLNDLTQTSVLVDKPFKSSSKRVDILITLASKNEKYLIAIENKINAHEGVGQTTDYSTAIEKDYHEYQNKLLIFLTPNNDAPEDEKWAILSYEDIYDILKNVCDEMKLTDNNSEQALIIISYKNLLEKKYMSTSENNTKIQELCRTIYEQHKNAINLIINNILSEKNMIAELIIKELDKYKEFIIYDQSRSKATNTYIRFNTQKMDSLIPQLENPNSSWDTKDTYYYWFDIDTNKNKIGCIFELGGYNLTQPIINKHEKIANIFNKKRKEYKYKRIWRKNYPINENKSFEENVKDIVEKAIIDIKEKEAKVNF